MPKEWKSNALGILGIILSLLAFVNKEYRLIAGIIFVVVLIVYILYSSSDEIDSYKERVEKLEENLNIHENLISIKADIKSLKEKVSKK